MSTSFLNAAVHDFEGPFFDEYHMVPPIVYIWY